MTEQKSAQQNSEYSNEYDAYLNGLQPQLNLDELNLPAEMLEKYTFVKKLGEGTQGNVYKAVRKSDGFVVAIKRIRIDSVSTWKEYDLFHREADVLASIHEKGVAEFYEAFEFLKEEKPSAFIVQELIEGRSLQLMLNTGYRFTVSRIFKMALGLVELLEKLHAHNPPIIHRDIKPNNVIMRPCSDSDDFEPCLIDFGAVANPTVQKGGSTVAGTYGYMPPEQLVGHPCPASDIYSLGATIVYMLTGVEPRDMRVSDFRLIIDPYLENVPRPIVTILHQMLDPKPETRLADYSKLKSIFTRFSNDDYRIDEFESTIGDALINQQLSKVNAFNQAGNLDLWMNLGEETPRKVPEAISYILLASDKIGEIQRQAAKAKHGSIKYYVLAFIASILVFVILNGNIDTQNAIYFALIVLGIALLAIWLLLKLDRDELKKKEMQVNLMMEYYEKTRTPQGIRDFCGHDQFEDIPMLTLLKFGRKAIATIIDFNDQPISDKFRFLDKEQIISRSKVPFKLRYRFNPPDDASADDLIHEITIYRHQTEGLEPGTPIPILYYIDPEDNSNVMSMPYPFPFKEILNTQLTALNKENLYGMTKGVY